MSGPDTAVKRDMQLPSDTKTFHTAECQVTDLKGVSNRGENDFNLLKPTGYVMHQQFNIQQLYALPTLYLCVLYLSENKQRLVSFTA